MSEAASIREPGELRGFPSSGPPPRLVRVCRASSATWWFSSDGSGRFDLPAPEGTCYLATDSYAAVREATRLGPVLSDWVAAREIRVVAPPDPGARLAATTRKSAGSYGLTTELVTALPYDLPRRWAVAFRAHRFDGIRHQLRHDQRARPSGVALFGPAGGSSADDARGTTLTEVAVQAAGVDVHPPPDSAALTVVT